MIRGNIEIKCMEGINPTVVNLLLRFKEFNGEGGKKDCCHRNFVTL